MPQSVGEVSLDIVSAEITMSEGETLSLFDQNVAITPLNEVTPMAKEIINQAFEKTLTELSEKRRHALPHLRKEQRGIT